jgi:hypothetical protein
MDRWGILVEPAPALLRLCERTDDADIVLLLALANQLHGGAYGPVAGMYITRTGTYFIPLVSGKYLMVLLATS